MLRILLAESQKKRFEWMNFIDFCPFHNELQGLWCLEEIGEGERCLAKPKTKKKINKTNQEMQCCIYVCILSKRRKIHFES